MFKTLCLCEQKYTVQPSGFWARLNKLLAIDPNRSTGVPLNPQFRNPPPGGNDPKAYDDPTTVPAADIAGNPYWQRDVRRSYPKRSVVNQSDVVGLLSVGSAAAPKEDVLQIGDAGKKQLVEVKEGFSRCAWAGWAASTSSFITSHEEAI
jgi:hypothetical protein